MDSSSNDDNTEDSSCSRSLENGSSSSTSNELHSREIQVNRSNDIFIASGPYFAQYTNSCDDDSQPFGDTTPSNTTNCNVVFSNIENLEHELRHSTASTSPSSSTAPQRTTAASASDNLKPISPKSNDPSKDKHAAIEANKKTVVGLKKLLQPFGGSNSNNHHHKSHHHHHSDASPLKQTKQLSSSTLEISVSGSSKNNNNHPNSCTNHSSRKAQPSAQNALKKLLSTSQELFHSKTKPHHSQPTQQQQQPQQRSQGQPTLLSIGAVASCSTATGQALHTSHNSSMPSSSSSLSSAPNTGNPAVSDHRPCSSNDDYNDLQTVPEDYKSAFQLVFSKKPKIRAQSKQLLNNKRHNRSKSLSQNFGSSPNDSDDDNIVSGTMINSQTDDEPIHMTLEEVKAMMASKSSRNVDTIDGCKQHEMKKSKLKQAFQHLLNKTHCITNNHSSSIQPGPSSNKSDILPQTVLDSFDNGPSVAAAASSSSRIDLSVEPMPSTSSAPPPVSPFGQRALPPVPKRRENVRQIRKLDSLLSFKMKNMTFEEREKYLLYLDSITRVKQCGWYWGPVSGEMAEKLLQNEPCGSFIVRDSSDEHYIFSLTFKLNGLIRHVRIEHDHGNFSFGPGRKYKNNTIVEFIEGAVEHSRNGQFLFFLHRVPIDGPDGVLRIQLLNPVSRFRTIQSLQHSCRFAILKLIRRDQIHLLDIPDMIKIYLDTPFYFSEELQKLHDGPAPLSDQVKWIVAKKRQHFLRLCAEYNHH